MPADTHTDLKVDINRRSRPRPDVRPAFRDKHLYSLHAPASVETTDASATNLDFKDGLDHQLLEDTHAYLINLRLVATQFAGGAGAVGDSAVCNVTIGMKRGVGVASVAALDAVTEVTRHDDAAAALWAVDIIADTVNGGFNVEVTGEADKSIRWEAEVEVSGQAYSA